MSGAKYPIANLIDLLAIPEDRLKACLEELPHALAAVRPVIELTKAMYDAAELPYTDADLLAIIAKFEWVDDDKGNVDTNVKFVAEGGDTLGTAHVHFNHKTGARSFKAEGKSA